MTFTTIIEPTMDRTLSLVSAATDPARYDAILRDPAFGEIEAYPHTGVFGRAYHPSVFRGEDLSFAVSANETALLVCLCASFDHTLGFCSLPLRLFARRGLDDATYRAAVNAAFANLNALAAAHGLRVATVREPTTANVSPLGEACLARGAQAATVQHACVDLTAGHAAWRAALRKSSRSLINWGKRSLAMRFVCRVTPDRDLFVEFQKFHAEFAGRVTRSQTSWDIMCDWIVSGRGELIAGYLDNRLISGSMFLDGRDICVYGTGVYDRTLFDKPLAHYPIWLAIERALARGLKTLELGLVHDKGTVSDKEYQIGYFKRGISTHIVTYTDWRWQPDQHRARSGGA